MQCRVGGFVGWLPCQVLVVSFFHVSSFRVSSWSLVTFIFPRFVFHVVNTTHVYVYLVCTKCTSFFLHMGHLFCSGRGSFLALSGTGHAGPPPHPLLLRLDRDAWSVVINEIKQQTSIPTLSLIHI